MRHSDNIAWEVDLMLALANLLPDKTSMNFKGF